MYDYRTQNEKKTRINITSEFKFIVILLCLSLSLVVGYYSSRVMQQPTTCCVMIF